MTEQDKAEARQAAAADYLRRHHQTRLAEAHRQRTATSTRPMWVVLAALLTAIALLVGLTADADAAPPPNAARPLAWPVATVERAAVRWLFATNPDVWGDGVRLEEAVASCSRTGRRYRCEVVSLWSYASGDEHGEQRDVLSRCTPDRRVRRHAASLHAARVSVRQGGTPGKRGGVRCARSTS